MGSKSLELIKRIDLRYRVAFIATFVLGMMTHMYAFTNQVQNHDYYANVHTDQFWWPLELGRCFLWPFTTISSFFSLPWVLGLLSMIYLAIAVCLIVSIFKVERTIPIIIISFVFISHPAITDLAGYLFTMDGYCAGIVFACLAVWIFENRKGKRALSGFVIFATLSFGIYQANLSFLIYLIVIKAVLEAYELHKLTKEYFNKYIRYIILTIVSFGMYFLCLKIMQSFFSVNMSSYAGFSTASFPSFSYFLNVLWTDGVEFVQRFLGNNLKFTAYEIFNFIFWILFLVVNVCIIIKEKIYKNILTILILFLSMIVMVYSMSIFDFASESLWYRWEMMQCAPLWYILFIILADRYLSGGLQSFSAILVSVISFNFFLIANITYFNQELAFQQTYSQSQLIVDRIISIEGYSKDTPIYVMGEYQAERRDWLLDRIPEHMTVDNVIMQDFFNVTHYNMGISLKQAEEEDILVLKDSEELSNMLCWPSSDSVKMIDGVIVVKFSD